MPPLPDKREGLKWPRLAIAEGNLELLIFVSTFNSWDDSSEPPFTTVTQHVQLKLVQLHGRYLFLSHRSKNGTRNVLKCDLWFLPLLVCVSRRYE